MCTGLRSTSCVSRWALASWDVWVCHGKSPSFLKKEGDNTSEIRVKEQDSPCRPPSLWSLKATEKMGNGQLEQIVSVLISGHSCSYTSKCLHWTMAWESCPEVLHLAQPLKNPFVYIFSLPWCSHLYMKETVVHWGQFNRMKHSIGTRDAVGKLGTFIPLVQSQLRFSFQQTKKREPAGPVMQWDLCTVVFWCNTK